MHEETDDRHERALALLLAQEHVLGLERHVLSAQLLQPDVHALTFGAGNDAEQTVPGDPQAPWRGLAILNPTPITIYAGAGPNGAVLPDLIVPPYSWLCAPVNYADYSLGVRGGDATGAPATVTFVQLHQPPAGVRAGQLGVVLPLADTQTFAGVTGVAPLAGTVVAQTGALTGVYEAEVTVSQAGSADDAATNLQLLNGSTPMGVLIDYMRATEVAWPTARLKRVTLNNAALSVAVVRNALANSVWSASIVITRIG